MSLSETLLEKPFRIREDVVVLLTVRGWLRYANTWSDLVGLLSLVKQHSTRTRI